MFDLTRKNNNNNRRVAAYNPYREMEDFERNFFSDPFASFFGTRDLAEFKTDVVDEGDHFLLEADLPGFDKKDIKLDLEDDVLTVKAERHSTAEQKNDKNKVVRTERSYGMYERSFDVSGVDTDKIKAAYEKGDYDFAGDKVKLMYGTMGWEDAKSIGFDWISLKFIDSGKDFFEMELA